MVGETREKEICHIIPIISCEVEQIYAEQRKGESFQGVTDS